MQKQPPIGKILTQPENRDAIHIAIAPVIAAEHLEAGQRVGLNAKGEAAIVADESSIGIVDPFLESWVKPGERFFLFLYPQTVTSLRHEWTHPAFADAAPVVGLANKENSESWLRTFIELNTSLDYELVIATAVSDTRIEDKDCPTYRYSENCGEWLHFNGRDACGEIPPEFWNHVEAVTGRKVPAEKRARAFSCSC